MSVFVGLLFLFFGQASFANAITICTLLCESTTEDGLVATVVPISVIAKSQDEAAIKIIKKCSSSNKGPLMRIGYMAEKEQNLFTEASQHDYFVIARIPEDLNQQMLHSVKEAPITPQLSKWINKKFCDTL